MEANGTLYIATEDGSTGTKGNVMDAVAADSLEADVIYACGPTPMLRAIKQYAQEKGIECYIFHGRENGMRNRSLSWMCLPVEGSG